MNNVIRSAAYNISMGMRMAITDRGLLFADFAIATTAPYVIQYLVWTSVYAANPNLDLEIFTRFELLIYYAYAISLSRLNNGYDIIERLASDVNDSSIETEILKPIPYPLQKFCLFVGEGFLYFLPIVFIFILHLSFVGLPSLAPIEILFVGVLIFFMVMISQILCFLISFLIAIGGFWFKKPDAALALMTVLPAFLGGALLPPSFWPEFLIPIMSYNPFAVTIAVPAAALTNPTLSGLLVAISVSVVYTLIFILLVWLAWRLALRQYDGSGG